MGYRSDVALALSKDGYDHLKLLLDGQHAAFSVEDCINAISFLDEADTHSIDSYSGDHLFNWVSIKSYGNDALLIFERGLGLINQDEWYLFDLGEDGAEEITGSYCDNTFNMYVSRSLNTEEGDSPMAGCGIKPPRKSGLIQVGPMTIVQRTVPLPVSSEPVNNYQCACGKMCDSSDKACWWCGAAIKSDIL